MNLLVSVRRALDGPIATAFVADAAGFPPALTLDKPQCPYWLRNELTKVITVARHLADDSGPALSGTGRAVSDRPAPAFAEQPMIAVVDLADVAGVTASKSGYRFDDIGPNADFGYLLGRYGCSSAEDLLQSGFRSAFRDDRQTNPTIVPAIRFGTRGPLYFCNIDGSHRITAARAELIRLQRPCPLAIDVRAIEPTADVVQLLERWDVVVASMPAAAITPLFQDSDIRRTAPMRCTVHGTEVLAVVRRGSRAARITDALARAGRAFSLRAFLLENGCWLAA